MFPSTPTVAQRYAEQFTGLNYLARIGAQWDSPRKALFGQTRDILCNARVRSAFPRDLGGGEGNVDQFLEIIKVTF